jgi:AcrR family transcriptional regulator
MPRAVDHEVEKRVLNAAQRLWRARGEKGLTLRAVAREARTTTTTVYKRFRNREALLLALAERVRDHATTMITGAATVRMACRMYLDFAETRPHEYRLFWGSNWPKLMGPGRPRPVRTWFLAALADEHGGLPEDYAPVHDAWFLLTHGTATLLAASRDSRANAAMRKSCLAACDRLIGNLNVFCPTSRRKAALKAS